MYNRKWVLHQVQEYSPKDITSKMIADEVRICTRVASVYSRNYYAWTYRNFIVSLMSLDELKQERQRMEEWARTHVSDYSGFHHRMVVLSLIGARVGLVSLEYTASTSAITSDGSSSSSESYSDRIAALRTIVVEELHMIRDLVHW